MHTEILAIDNCSQGQTIEEIHNYFVSFLIIMLKTLVSKVKHLSHVARFVVATQEENIDWEPQLQG